MMIKAFNLNTLNRFSSTFSGSKRGDFFQKAPKLSNQFLEDVFLREQLELEIPKEFFSDIENDLTEFGHKVATNIYDLHLECEKNPPKLEKFDAWGNRIDKLITCNAWKEMKKISATEGLVSIPYEKKFSIYSRLYQILKLYIYGPSSGLFGCPLAMTDGAAVTIKNVGIQNFTQEAYLRLTSRDSSKFWTSGQWMTERQGGSDVANGTETIAVKQPGNEDLYKLYGYKWFSSATDSDMTITLARIVDENMNISKGLTMFFARIRNDENKLNGIEIQTLKNKLGTRQLPTAEVLLDGMNAYKMSEQDKGISKMASMLNITRIHNSLSAVANMRRTVNLARDYATKRMAFGKLLIDHDLHAQTICNMEVECRASFLTLVFTANLLGKIEVNQASREELELLRFLTPLLKLYTAKQAISVASEGLECFGGQGFIEDTGLPNLLRDSQVLSIWEGTTNILSLDVLRSIKKSDGESLKIFFKHIKLTCEKSKSNPLLCKTSEKIIKLTTELMQYAFKQPENEQIGAREFAYSLYRIFTASLIIDRCLKTDCKESDLYLLKKWCMQDLVPFVTYNKNELFSDKSRQNNLDLIMSGHPSRIH